ncbi:hypothetical protein C9374_013841 [Naegleria lovaniensis]|uniref:Uncharacterized protein n=1 Tax=Naegleria lovaniensis TaxID=51637 RepID=A0AA88GVN1_NAELO|nr:uncharacterized protein C9374_013841 [Naegleria lovaniensis]KAG2389281.1 hypothetical protein C9374_013841 [Naegleria lovaniensis]
MSRRDFDDATRGGDDTTTTAIETTKLYSLHRIKLFKLFTSLNTLFTLIVIIYMIVTFIILGVQLQGHPTNGSIYSILTWTSYLSYVLEAIESCCLVTCIMGLVASFTKPSAACNRFLIIPYILGCLVKLLMEWGLIMSTSGAMTALAGHESVVYVAIVVAIIDAVWNLLALIFSVVHAVYLFGVRRNMKLVK